MKVSATCPAYVTGMFSIEGNDAAGAGFAIDKRLTTSVSAGKGRTTIMINSKECAAPVSKAVMQKYSEINGKLGVIEIKHSTIIPIGCGLGMSAAGAVSLSLCLNEFLGCGLKFADCVKIAHDSEVLCGTGLSGADAAAIGGILARKTVNDAPVKLPFEEREFEFAFFAPIKTASITREESWKKRVNAACKNAMDELFEERTLDGLVLSSRRFAKESGLAGWCEKEMDGNPRASMTMVGETLFSDAPMRLSRKPFALMKAKTYEGGAGIE